MSTPLLLSVYYILKRTTIQNSEYFTRLLITSLNSIYSISNVLCILYYQSSEITINISNIIVIHLIVKTMSVLTRLIKQKRLLVQAVRDYSYI